MQKPKDAKVSDRKARNLIGGRLRHARLAHEPPLTQDQLSGKLAAKGLTLDRVAITKIENGQRCVFDFELPVLSDVLKVDVRWLLGIQNVGGSAKRERASA